MKTMGAALAKTHFLALLDQVEMKRESITVTKNGRKVAEINPIKENGDPLAVFKFGGFDIVGDIVSPVSSPDDWEYD
jgi:antitoxin (DNA-binding transcriptional repressor) of toxin-antitoxin stability system